MYSNEELNKAAIKLYSDYKMTKNDIKDNNNLDEILRLLGVSLDGNKYSKVERFNIILKFISMAISNEENNK